MPAQNEAQWSVDSFHNEISFKVEHLFMPNEKHFFKRFDADIYATSKDFSATDDIYWIDGSSINIDREKKWGCLKSANFFDVKSHRHITFISNSFYCHDDSLQYELSGELTMKGICHPIKLMVRFSGIVIQPEEGKERKYLLTGSLSEAIGEIFRTPLKAVDKLTQIPYINFINLN